MTEEESHSKSTPGTFQLMEDKSGEGGFFHKGKVKASLTKWDLLRGMKYYQFRYDKFYHKADSTAFTQDFFNDENVRRAIFCGLGEEEGKGAPPQFHSGSRVTSFSSVALKTSVTSMEFFDKMLERSDVVRSSSGLLVKCMDDYHHGFHVQDTLRDILLNEDNEAELENGELFSEEEKEEFLHVIFRHLAIGGSLCQFEDRVGPYLDLTKAIYKELLTVWKNPRKSGKVEIASGVYAVTDIKIKGCSSREGGGEDGDGEEAEDFFQEGFNPQNWFYISTDPFRRICKVWVHHFKHHW